MILSAPPDIQISHTKQANDNPISTSAIEKAGIAKTGRSPMTLTIETTHSNRLKAPNNCIPRIKISRFRRFCI